MPTNNRTTETPTPSASDPVPSGGAGSGKATDEPKKRPKDLNELKDAKRAAVAQRKAQADSALLDVLAQLLANPTEGVVVADGYVAEAAKQYGLEISTTSSNAFYVRVPD